MKSKTSPKDFFLYLSVIVTLYVSAISLLRLFFEMIDTAFPDPLSYSHGFYDGTLRGAIASLIVIFPLHIFLSCLWNKNMRREPEKRELWVRRWFTYLTLFVAGVTLAVDLILLIDHFLGGDLTARFTLKVVAVFLTAGAIFGYFIYDLRREVAKVDKRLKIFAWSSGIIILASLILGFVIIGSPWQARLRRFDEQRISNLQEIQWRVVDFWQRNRKLPESLETLKGDLYAGGNVFQVDPETGQQYEYRRVADLKFELCGKFSTDSKEIGSFSNKYPKAAPVPAGVSGPAVAGVKGNESWEHAIGRACFERVIDPALYPQPPKEVIR